MSTALTVDAIVVDKDFVLVIKRRDEPFKGMYALPGGFVEHREDPKDAVLRELKEETNLDGQHIELVCVKGSADRDPRQHVVSIVYKVNVKNLTIAKAGDDAVKLQWVPLELLLEDTSKLAFDHGEILQEFNQIYKII
jgi:8-oxo-dGTP diphosphatase